MKTQLLLGSIALAATRAIASGDLAMNRAEFAVPRDAAVALRADRPAS